MLFGLSILYYMRKWMHLNILSSLVMKQHWSLILLVLKG